MTPDEPAIRERHVPCCDEHESEGGFCDLCGYAWPCDARRAADALTEAEAERDRLRLVVAAAEDWRDARALPSFDSECYVTMGLVAAISLIGAIDEYRAALKADR